MFDSKILIIILVLALIVFGTTRLRTIGMDVGAALKGFRQAIRDTDPSPVSIQSERIPPQD